MTISATKSQVILRIVPLVAFQSSGADLSETNASLSIEIYYQVKPILSSIINYITQNFGSLMVTSSLHTLTTDDLSLILSHRKINVASEDEVIDALLTWFSHNIKSISDDQIL